MAASAKVHSLLYELALQCVDVLVGDLPTKSPVRQEQGPANLGKHGWAHRGVGLGTNLFSERMPYDRRVERTARVTHDRMGCVLKL